MKLIKDTIIIGGLPNPIGGVTTFLSRLVRAYPQYVIEFLDLYPSKEKRVPKNFTGFYKLASNKLLAFFIILKIQFNYSHKELFFNFSTGKSLIFFLFLPKLKNNWSLMLHHGNLEVSFPYFFVKYVLRKFDVIYALSDRQEIFFRKIDRNLNIIRENSYVPATLVEINEFDKQPLIALEKTDYKIVVGSGSPTPLYQHHLLIDIVNNNSNLFLFLFLYGNGELKQELLNLKHPRVQVFLDKDEDTFNYYLANANLYIRPTLEDSFGIACADAVEFGVPVIASDVCERYSGVITYKVNVKEELYDYSIKLSQ